MKLDLNTEQLEFLQFILDNFEYNDDEERALKDSIESQLYEVREQDLLIAMKIASSHINPCLLYTSPSPRDATLSRMPSSA